VTDEVDTVGVGAAESITKVLAAEVEEFPAASVTVILIDQVPFANVESEQDPALIVQLTDVDPDLVAVTTPVPVKPLAFIVGVVFEVIPSLFEAPVSLELASVGALGVGSVKFLITTPVNDVLTLEFRDPRLWTAVTV
jgi:hypothetical protein